MKKDKKFPEFDFIESIPKGKKLVCAGKPRSNPHGKPLGKVFIVDDVDDPEIPGFPAKCIGGNGDCEYAEEFIKHTYKRLSEKQNEQN